jgi:hypothetical protein
MKAQSTIAWLPDATAEDLVGADRRRAAISRRCTSMPFNLHRASDHAVSQRQHLQPPAGKSG